MGLDGKGARRKGHNFERWLAKTFREKLKTHEIKRGLQPQGGANAPDVDMPIYWVEAKCGKRPSPRAALAQAERDTDGRVPVAIIKDDYQQPFCLMRLADLLGLTQAATGSAVARIYSRAGKKQDIRRTLCEAEKRAHELSLPIGAIYDGAGHNYGVVSLDVWMMMVRTQLDANRE